MRYYLDTCIWLDVYEKRGKNGERAFAFIQDALQQGDVLLYSDTHLLELKTLGYPPHEIVMMFRYEGSARVHSTKAQREQAKKLATTLRIPAGDALHALIARENDAILISSDRHFDKLRSLVEVRRLDG